MTKQLPNGDLRGSCMGTGGGADSRIVYYSHFGKFWEILGDGVIQLKSALIVKGHQSHRNDWLGHRLDKIEFVSLHASRCFLISKAIGLVIYLLSILVHHPVYANETSISHFFSYKLVKFSEWSVVLL